ncbi:MAG TPA: hypothetical protein VN578_21055 [Candidatus Binatia bacterium]|jgi:hypothetical protein|nr:hypothetical protein [Candidatus Binatia bacterium]
MKPSGQNGAGERDTSRSSFRPLWLIAGGCLLFALVVILLPRTKTISAACTTATEAPLAETRSATTAGIPSALRLSNSAAAPAAAKTAEEVVAAKLAQFARSRRNLAYALARRYGVEVPDEVNRFFDAVESGDWDEIQARFSVINGGDSSASHGGGRPPAVNEVWSAIIDAYGAAEQVHLWPAQKLLDYGNSVLGSLSPGMVYVGGTDNGRWIPELLNDTSDGERHIVVTQNGLADGKYLDYVSELYSDRLATLTPEDAQRAFQDYIADAQKRLQHDQQFPDEPKQVRPSENITDAGGQIQVSGQVAVMQINEKLLQMLMQKNPDLSFAMQESFPMKGTYAEAVPLGPLMELHVPDAQNTFTPERAAQSLDFWRTTAEDVLADPEATGSTDALKSYSHDAASAANLLAAHNYTAEAEQAYRLSSQLWPGNPEAVGNLATLLANTGRSNEAHQLLDNFARNYPDQHSAIDTFWSVVSTKHQ